MKNWTRLSLLPLLAFGSYACQEAASETNAADLAAAAKMIGETLSDERDGLMTTMFDATANITGTGMSFNGFAAKELSDAEIASPGGPGGPGGMMNPLPGRGGERNVKVTYDSLTGVHTVTFDRTVSFNGFTKSVAFVHKYIYKNEAGAFVRFPRRLGYASVEFEGNKTGSVNGPRGASSFSREGAFTLSGLQLAATTLSYDGEFKGTGRHSFNNEDSVSETRDMAFTYKLTNVQIAKTALKLEEPLSEGVTGTIDYKVTMKKTINGEVEEDVLEGTIDLTGDGTALLKYLGHSSRFVLNLGNGEARRRR